MQSGVNIRNLKRELAEVMSLKPLQGLTVPQALEAARAEYSRRERNYQLWAVDRSNERAYRQARAALDVIEHVVRVLEVATTPAPVAQAAPVAHLATAAASVAAKPTKERCPHYGAIRRFFGYARGAKLNTKNEDAIRDALAGFVGRTLETRADLSGIEWSQAAEAVRRGALAW